MVQRRGYPPNKHRTNVLPPQQNGNKYGRHLIQGQKDQHLDQKEERSYRHNQPCEKNEVVLSAHRPMDLKCHHLETIRKENTIRKTSQAVEKRPGQIQERHDLAEDRLTWRPLPNNGILRLPNDDDDDDDDAL